MIENEKTMSFRCGIELATAIELEAKRRGISKTDVIKEVLNKALLGEDSNKGEIEEFKKEFKAVVSALNNKIKQLESRLQNIESVEKLTKQISQPSPFDATEILKQNFDPSKFL